MDKEDRVTDVRVGEPLFSSAYLKPARVFYKQDTIGDLSWDVVEVFDGVSIVLFNKQQGTFIVVHQFRPAVWAAVDRNVKKVHGESATAAPSEGYVYELCGGLLNKPGKSLEQHAVEEVEEETGYTIPQSALQLLFVFREAVGILGNSLHVFYAEVDDSMRTSAGGGCLAESEVITVESIPVSQVLSFLRDDKKQKSIELVHAFLLLSCSPRIRTPLITAASSHVRPSPPVLPISDAAYAAACASANGDIGGGGNSMFHKWVAQWFSSYAVPEGEGEKGGPGGNTANTTTTIVVAKPRRHWFALSFIAFTAGIAGGWMLHEQLSVARMAVKAVRWIYAQWHTRQ